MRILFFIGIIISLLATDVIAASPGKPITIGRLIATGKDFDVYSPMYELDGKRPVCPAQFKGLSGLSPEEYQKIQNEYVAYQKKKKGPVYEAYNRKIKALLKPYEKKLKNISARNRVEWNKEASKINEWRQEEEKKLYEWQKKEYARIEAEAEALKNKALKGKGKEQYFYLYVIHSPSDPEQTIVPLNGRHVTQDYLRYFNRIVSPFLSTCVGELNTVQVIHYYRDQFNAADNTVPGQQHIVWFNYRYHDGKLVVKDDKYPSPMYFYDPKQNTRLTLAGFRAKQSHKKRMAAVYRKNFSYAEGRKPGIVYKLDPFWRQYEQFEIARRIFDGDFVEFNKTIEFKAMYMALADVYSKRCSDKVAQFTTFKIPYTAYAGSEWNLDGSQTIHEVEGMKTIRIDSRFAEQWSNYKPAVNSYLAKKVFSNLGSARDLMRMSVSRAKQVIGNFTGNMLVEHYQMDKFLKEQGCDSATVQQMVDNFLRAGNGMNSVQRDGIQYQGAEKESDPVKKKGTQPLVKNPLYQVSSQSRGKSRRGETDQQVDTHAERTSARYTQQDMRQQSEQEQQRRLQELRKRQQLEQQALREIKRKELEAKNKKMLEKYARMNKEVKSLEDKYAKEYRKAVDDYSLKLENAKTNEDRIKAAREYKKIRLEQARRQREEIKKLREKYR